MRLDKISGDCFVFRDFLPDVRCLRGSNEEGTGQGQGTRRQIQQQDPRKRSKTDELMLEENEKKSTVEDAKLNGLNRQYEQAHYALLKIAFRTTVLHCSSSSQSMIPRSLQNSG